MQVDLEINQADKWDNREVKKLLEGQEAASRALLEKGGMVNNKIERELLRDSKSKGARVLDAGDLMGGNFTLSKRINDHRLNFLKKNGSKNALNDYAKEVSMMNNRDYDNYNLGIKRFKNRIKNSVAKGEHQILHSSGSGTDFLAHEIGHIDNEKSKGLRKLINKIGNDPDNRYNFQIALQGGKDDNSSIREGIKRFIKGKSIVQEEKNASKYALKKLKELGASNEELQQAKNNLKDALKSYQTGTSYYYTTPFRNKLRTPGKRGKKSLQKMVEDVMEQG